MNEIGTDRLVASASMRYPNARIYVLDDRYEVPTKPMLRKAHKNFNKGLWKYGILKWLKNKFDCDKFAWSFKSYVNLGNALSKNNNAQAVGFITYCIDGDKSRPHAINNSVWRSGMDDAFQFTEIEPQRSGGLITLTKKERDTVWLVIF